MNTSTFDVAAHLDAGATGPPGKCQAASPPLHVGYIKLCFQVSEAERLELLERSRSKEVTATTATVDDQTSTAANRGTQTGANVSAKLVTTFSADDNTTQSLTVERVLPYTGNGSMTTPTQNRSDDSRLFPLPPSIFSNDSLFRLHSLLEKWISLSSLPAGNIHWVSKTTLPIFGPLLYFENSGKK